VEVGYDSYRDQWLSEAFAEYSALLYLEHVSGRAQMLSALARYRDDIFSVRSYAFGRGKRSGSIALGYRASSTQTEGDFDLVVYKKGAYVLHMLRLLLTNLETQDDSAFFALLREFYSTYKGRDATTEDFKRLAEKYAREDLGWFFKQWVYGEELPTCKLSYRSTQGPDGTWTVNGTIDTKGVSDGFRLDLPLEIDFDGSKPLYVRRTLESKQFDFAVGGLPQKPNKVKLNPLGAVLAKTK
jgi:aminopeptidase N